MSATQGMDLIVHFKLTIALSPVLHLNDNEMIENFTPRTNLAADLQMSQEPEQDLCFGLVRRHGLSNRLLVHFSM